MHIRLFILLVLTTSNLFGQAVTVQGKITNSRSEFVNKAGKRFTLDGVLPTGMNLPIQVSLVQINAGSYKT
jgi:hypothetical protein